MDDDWGYPHFRKPSYGDICVDIPGKWWLMMVDDRLVRGSYSFLFTGDYHSSFLVRRFLSECCGVDLWLCLKICYPQIRWFIINIFSIDMAIWDTPKIRKWWLYIIPPLSHCFSPPARWGLLDFIRAAASSFRLLLLLLLLASSCRRTSTTAILAKCWLPDLNHGHPSPVLAAGPQPRPAPPSVGCRTSTTAIPAQCWLPDLNHHVKYNARDNMSDRMLEDMSDRMSDRYNVRYNVRHNVRRYVRYNVR